MTAGLRRVVAGITLRQVALWAIAFALLLTFVPAFDIWVSGLFYDEAGRAWVNRGPFLQFMRSGVPPLIIGCLVFLILVWLGGRIAGGVIEPATGRSIGYLLASLIAGPGLIVESLLKSVWGRARPREVTEFGGPDVFTPAVWISDACEKNCSFVSGHAALGFWTTAFALILPAHMRGPALAVGVGFGAVMGLARMAEGAHFLSDIVYAGLIVVGLNAWLADKMLRTEPDTEAVSGA